MDAADDTLVKLPLMGKSLTLEALPGQDPAVQYGVVWDVCEQPGDGLGYVVRFEDARECRILAWMGRNGTVVECDRPIAFLTPGVPAIALHSMGGGEGPSGGAGMVDTRRHGSDELVHVAAYREYFPSQVAFFPAKGTDIPDTGAMARILGSYADKKMAWRAFVAVSYLAFYLLPRLGGGMRRASGDIADVLRAFTARPLADAVDSLIFRVLEAQEGEGESSGFERYAARMLQQAGASELRQVMAHHEVGIARLSTTRLFWMRFGEDVSPEERAVLLSVESCLNRLALIELALKAAGDSTALADCREARCALEDRHALARVADAARGRLEASGEENPYCSYLPANPQRGGEWDVRTRFLRACEGLRLPFRLEYRFDCHAEAGILLVRFGLPPQRAFPESRWSDADSRWVTRAEEVPAAATCYALRLAALLAACGFGTGMGMRQVVVTGCREAVGGEPLLSLRFERMSFLNRTQYRIEMGTVSRVGGKRACTAADAEVLLSLLAPLEAQVNLGEDGGLLPVEPIDQPLPEGRLPLSDDARYLPAAAAHLLHANRVRDLDADANTDLRELDEVHTAVEEAAESRLLAIARLEGVVERNPVQGLADPDDIVAAAEAALRGGAAPVPGYDRMDEDGETRPVRLAYFPNLIARCLADAVARREDEEFEPVPAQAYLARSALAKLYLQSGDVEAAVARVRECAALAPASAGLLLENAQLLMAAQEADEAVELLAQALRVCVRQQMANVLYAHLAGAFWAGGKLSEALACFTLARRFEQGQSGFDAAILQLVQRLGMKGMPSVDEAVATLRACGIPLAPTDGARQAVISTAVEFTDARMFELAWPLVGAVGIDLGNDVMAMMGEHLRLGVS